MRPCEICGRPGQKHHIVFRSQGGMNIQLNFAYLCPEHHTEGRNAAHNDRAFDLLLKIRMQRRLEEMFRDPEYGVCKIAKLIGYDRRRLGCRMKAVPKKAGKYRREDIIRFFMGGRLYEALRPVPPAGEAARDPGEGFIFLEEENDLCPKEGDGNREENSGQ